MAHRIIAAMVLVILAMSAVIQDSKTAPVEGEAADALEFGSGSGGGSDRNHSLLNSQLYKTQAGQITVIYNSYSVRVCL